MQSSDPADVRRRVALAGHRGDPTTIRAEVDHPDWRVRASALRALDRSGSLTAADLDRSLSDPEPEVRGTAVELAAKTPEPSLLAALSDTDPRVVEVACWSTAERRPPEPGAVARLVDVAGSHDDPLCRESAIAALGAIGQEAGLSSVIAGLDDKPAVRRRAVVALAAFDGPRVDAALERARGDSDRQVRDAVDELLGPA
jgi:HEAT repeat protein